MRVLLDGEVLADSRAGEGAVRDRAAAAVVLPVDDVRMDLLDRVRRRRDAPTRGEASYLVAPAVEQDVAWHIPIPITTAS